MEYIMFVIVRAVRALLLGLEIAMLLRAILSWFPIDEDNRFLNLLYCITEPIIMPVRALLEKLGWFQDLPLDMSFFFTYILLSVVSMLL
ncbi:MAG: YggT family protein [Clostridia bacterium]|nr:YggT family protein [Clostridia bacterium]